MKKLRRPNTDKMRRNVARSTPDLARRTFSHPFGMEDEETEEYHRWVAYWRNQWDKKYPQGYTMVAHVEDSAMLTTRDVTIVIGVQRRTDEYTTVRPGSRRLNHYLVR